MTIFVGDNDHGDSKPTLPMYLSVLADNAALREDLKASLEANDDGINDALMEELWQRRTEMYAMKEQIKQLTNERDEARTVGGNTMNLKDIVDEVFAKHDAECLLLIEQLNKTTIERDKARRMYCGVDNCTADEAMLLAKEQGWDCYKKEETQ